MRERGIGTEKNTPGIWRTERGLRICTVAEGNACSLVLYEAGAEKGRKIPFPKENRVGSVWTLELSFEDLNQGKKENGGNLSETELPEYEYMLEADGIEYADPFCRSLTGWERWGDAANLRKPFRGKLRLCEYDWEGDAPLETPMQDTVIYRLHPRGFTKHASSGCKHRGTFAAILEKLPYLKELGITAVELMPSYEFQELMTVPKLDEEGNLTAEATGRLNYWGYGAGYYFAPKTSYSAAGAVGGNPEEELKGLIKELHRAGIELYLELYFPPELPAFFVREAARFWVREYHADGIHLVGRVDPALAEDPVLSKTKLFADYWDERGVSGSVDWKRFYYPKNLEKSGNTENNKNSNNNRETGNRRHVAEYNHGFLLDMRRVLRGEEDLVGKLTDRLSRNPESFGVVNYMAHTNGYTMADLVTYEEKYNEANGEENRDGSNENVSWNCGVEGVTRSRRVKRLRKKQLRNAYLLLLLSQGIPMLQAGDEFGNTQKGNNNAYCQDNEISWLNWRQLQTNRDQFEFVKRLLAFRKAHPVFHKEKPALYRDYKASGIPDLSYHGVKAWYPEYDRACRQLGVLYNGSYEKKADGSGDAYFYAAFNLHRKSSEFGLPRLPKGFAWYVVIDSNAEEQNGFYGEGQEPLVADAKNCTVAPNSIVVLMGKPLQPEASE